MGSSGTFGLQEVSRTAREIEIQVKQLSVTVNYSMKENASIVNGISVGIINLIVIVGALSEKPVNSTNQRT